MDARLFLASLLALCLGLCEAATLTQGDIDILNFALNLECLEAQFYSFAAYGRGLSSGDRRNGPLPVGGKRALLSSSARKLAIDIANDEILHVRFLRRVLGRNAVQCPAVNIGSAFQAAAVAAFGGPIPHPFDAYASDILFYHAAFIFEDVGVTAYAGALALLKDPSVITASGGILATESYHAGAIRDRLTLIGDQYVFPYATRVTGIIGAIANLRAAVGGGKDGGLNRLVPANNFAIAYARNVTEVLNIVYLSTNSTPGGFFPNGLNGNIK